MAKKSLSSKSNYIPKSMINEIEVSRKGKVTDIDGASLLDGAYVKKNVKFAKGSTVKSNKKSPEEAYEQEQEDAMFNSEYGQGGKTGCWCYSIGGL
jgi:hypothetical protein